MSRYYTPRTLAQTWDCSPDVVYDLLRTGKLKGFRVGRHWRVSDEARLEYEQRKSDIPEDLHGLRGSYREGLPVRYSEYGQL